MIINSFFNLRLEKDRPFIGKILQTDFSLLKDLRIIVVGNCQDSQLLVKMILEDYQAQVKTVTGADECLKTMQEWQVDILISDIRMKEKDGYWLIRTLREKEVLPQKFISAIALTAYWGELDAALKAGYQNAFLIPFDIDNIVAAVAKIAGRCY
ncbi:response regulator receiver protein (plasmid) [Calothrix sp. NIES-4071]|nr:response regulator receiver protein [Calothrix sp. NIES-4071]BAZ64394.1 response regulator receiver protein [Calothrix sp. NIES-4105]